MARRDDPQERPDEGPDIGPPRALQPDATAGGVVDVVPTATKDDEEEEVNDEEGRVNNIQSTCGTEEAEVGVINEDRVADGGTDDNYDDDLPAYLQGPLDPARMELTEEEREWALDVKDAIEGLPDLDSISDFMMAQIALVEWESQSLEKAIDHAYNLQNYREAFGIQESFSEAARGVEFNIRRHPGYVLHFCRMEGHYAVVFDMTKFDTGVLSDETSKERMHKASYYFNHAFTPDLAAVREGVLWIVECQGFLWKAPKMLTLDIFRMGFEDFISFYPFRFQQMSFCNTGVMVNTMVSMAKRYIPDRLHKKFLVGLSTESRLDSICLIPTPEEAADRVVKAMTESLRRRYEAEKTFRLE